MASQPPFSPEMSAASAAALWARFHPGETAQLRVVARANLRSGKRLQRFVAREGAAAPITTAQAYAPEVFDLPVVDIDLTRVPAQASLPPHVRFWNLLTRTREKAACPRCGAPDLEVRRSGKFFYVLHCGSAQPMKFAGQPAAVQLAAKESI